MSERTGLFPNDAAESFGEGAQTRTLFPAAPAGSAPIAGDDPVPLTTASLFTAPPRVTAPPTDNDPEGAEPPLPAVNHSARGYSGLRPRITPGRLVAALTALVAVAALVIGAIVFMTRPGTDALGPLRDAERGLYSAERALTRVHSTAVAQTETMAPLAEQTLTYSEGLRGIVPDATVNGLIQAAEAIVSVADELENLTVPTPYQREIAEDADASAIAAAVAEVQSRQSELEELTGTVTATQAKLTLREQSLHLASNAASKELILKADATLALPEPVVDETFRTAISTPLEQLRPYADGGAEVATLWSTVTAPLRALLDEQARILAEEAKKAEEEEAEQDYSDPTPTTPTTPTTPVDPQPVDPEPVDPEPVDPMPTDPAPEPTAPAEG